MTARINAGHPNRVIPPNQQEDPDSGEPPLEAEAIASAGHERERAWRLDMVGSAQAFDAGEITVLPDPGDPRGRATRPPATTVHSATCRC